MKILMASSEMTPLAQTGRLGEAVEALAGALQAAGHEVSVVLPLYSRVRNDPSITLVDSGLQLTLPLGEKRHQAVVYEAKAGGAASGVQLFLIGRDEYFDRSELYGPPGKDYGDNAERFIFFSRAVVELTRYLSPGPDVVHLHDWQTALAAVMMKDAGLPFPTVLSLHDLRYQGIFWGLDFALTSLPGHYFTEHGVEFHGQLNCLKGGILHADAIIAGSARYARAIQTPAHGHGLDGALKARAGRLYGIPPGLDRSRWNPERDSDLAAPYSADVPEGKTVCRDSLLRELGLKPNPAGPVLAFFHQTATSGQTLDLLMPVLDRFLTADVRMVLVGEEDPRFERDLRVAARQYPGKFAFRASLDETLGHQTMAGADLLLLSSHPDPSGENSMIALSYGTLPIARAASGLHQLLQDYDGGNTGNAFIYYEESTEALWDALRRARRLFEDRPRWQAAMCEAMAGDFSWAASARRIEQVYEAVYGRV